MAKKTGLKTIHRDTLNHNRNHQTLPDEITLRDEILELKRQVMVLKRTNEQHLVKLRKYEDESKRKDKQLEQLLDPRKNADITKVLSTKGAAILMNLKDQNNTLIQMILNKDLHIRRLAAELKMSKLYASTRKNEGYRAEIARLRNLLLKSQETVRENVDVQQRARSIGVSGNSPLEFSSSSDQSSPRDLEELRATILSLESHIQHSNDLLAKKNQEILHLTDELHILRKFFRCRSYKNKTFESDSTETKHWSEPLTKTSSQHNLEAFDKKPDENLPHSAPAAPTKCTFPSSSTPKYTSHNTDRGKENQTKAELPIKDEDNFEKGEKSVPALGKSLFHNIATNEILKEEKILSNSRKIIYTKGAWKRALEKVRELKKLKPEMFTGFAENQEKENEITAEFFCEESAKSITESYQENSENFQQEFDSSGLFKTKTDETERSITPDRSSDGAVSDNDSTSEMCQNPEKNVNKQESLEPEKSLSKEEHFNAETEELFESYQNPWNQEENGKNKRKSLREIYRQSLDSSFESECEMKHPEVRQVQVEVQINTFSPQTDSDQSENSFSENVQKFEHGRKTGENCVGDFDFNDDDDVIVREK